MNMSASDFHSSAFDDYDVKLDRPPPNKKYRVTPSTEYTESDLLPPTILGTLLPIPPIPPPETKESVRKLLAPYKSKIIPYHAWHARNNNIRHPRISVIKHNHSNNNGHAHRTNNTDSSLPASESSIHGYITVYDIPDSCWSLIFHFCPVPDLVFNIASSNKFFQTLVIDMSTWIHRRVVLPSKIYQKCLKQKVQNTLESIFLNWTSLKQLDIMIAPDTEADRITFMWRLLCAPRPKIEILRIGNSINLPGGDVSAVTEAAFKYLRLIQDIQVIDFSFNMFAVSFESIIDFFAAQAGQVYNPPPKAKKSYLSRWTISKNQKTNERNNQNKNSNDNNNTNNEALNDDSITPLPFDDVLFHSPPFQIINDTTDSSKSSKKHKKIKMNVKHHSDSDIELICNNHTNSNNKSERPETKNTKKRSVLGKRSIDGIGDAPLPKKKKLKRSEKREMDSDEEDQANKPNHNEYVTKVSPSISRHSFKHFTRRKKRRTSDGSLTERGHNKNIKAVTPTHNRKIKKMVYHKRKRLGFDPMTKRKRQRIRRPHRGSHSGSTSPRLCRKRQSLRKHKLERFDCRHVTANNDNMDSKEKNAVKVKKEVSVPKEFHCVLSSTPSPITSPILDMEAFNTSIYGKTMRKTILSNIDPSLMSTLKDLNNDELELNLSLTLNIDSIDIGLNDNDKVTTHSLDEDNDRYYESYRENLQSDYLHIDRKKDSMQDLGRKSKLRRIYFRELCMKSFPDLAYSYLNTMRIESLSLYTGDTSSLIAFIDKCGTYPVIKKIEIEGSSPFRWRCAPLCEALSKCINLCSIQLPSIVDAVDIIAFDSFVNAAVNLTEIGLVTGDRQLFKPIHDVIHKHGFKMDINPSGLRFIFARRKNKPKLREKYHKNKKKFMQRRRSNTY